MVAVDARLDKPLAPNNIVSTPHKMVAPVIECNVRA